MPAADEAPGLIHQAMRYSLFAGGKRLRPVLSIAAGELFEAPEEALLPVACSLEMIHTYSLVHDDLPAMDNDDLRRGLPTCHVRFGEAIAILAGDALLTQAFITLSSLPSLDRQVQVRVIRELATASGTANALIGGQVLDLQFEGKPVTTKELEEIHRAKTGALIRCAVRTGAIIGGASDVELEALTLFGEKIGLAFQITDDLLDETATTEELGKTAGKDAATHKATYTSLYGVEESRRLAAQVTREAIDALQPFGKRGSTLRDVALFVIERRS
ncbi:MAG: hypothetical protein RIR52_1671 [Acidobacteriota bacterium]